jgi:hypothetical protein
MGSLSFRRTPVSFRSDDPGARGPEGSITMATTLLFLAFSVLGMSMLFLSQVHMKAGAGRKLSLLLDYASENGIKRALEPFITGLDLGDTLVAIPPALAAAYKEDALRGGRRIAADFLGWEFPLEDRETWDGTSWSSTTSCPALRAEDGGEYVSVTYGIRIDAEGSLAGFRPKRASSCSASLEALTGRLPLPFIPLFINKDMTPEQRADLMEAGGISFRAAGRRWPDGRPPRLQTEGAPLIPKDALPQLAKALKIDLFRPEDLNNAVLRRALGLEPSNEPVPDGVYLIRDDLGLGGIFVQGDVVEMVAAIDGDFQVIRFAMDAGEWTLRFSPELCRTLFETPSGSSSFDMAPAGIICVNGSIASLGGGIVEPSGRIVMGSGEAAPSILAGVSLTIVCSDRVAISSHLFSQGVRWRDGVPYLKDADAQVIIFATGKDLLDGKAADGRISVAEGSPRKLTVQASLVAAGAGFVIEGAGKEVELLGGLQTTDLAMGRNSLAISPDKALSGARPAFAEAPLTTGPMRYITAFRVLEWREHE